MDSMQKRLDDEVKRVAASSLAAPKISKDLKPIISKVKLPSSYKLKCQSENISLPAESLEIKLRFNCLKKFNDRHLEKGQAKVELNWTKELYFKEFDKFLYEDANCRRSINEELNSSYDDHVEEDVFLRNTIVEAIVLRKFERCMSVVTSYGEEFLVKVKPDWPGMGLSIGVGDVVRVFKPKKDLHGKSIQSDPELVCCYCIELGDATMFLQKLQNSDNILEDFLRCRAVWEYILNNSIADEQEKINCCKIILFICDKINLLQSQAQMSAMAKQFWSSFKGTKFLNEVLPMVVNKDSFKSDIDTADHVLKFIENIMKVIPECAIKVSEIVNKLNLENNMMFMQKLFKCVAENVSGAKDDLESLQWNQKPLIPASSELLDSATQWETLPHIKVKKKDKPDEDFKYSSEEEYLNTKFTLLREECFHNMKDGIKQYIKDGEFDSKNVMMYRISLVKVGSDYCHEGLSFLLDFKHVKTSQATDIDPDNTRWLMSGNLLCISLDASFRCPIWATVANTKIKEKDKLANDRQVYVTFSTEMNSLSDAEVITKLQQLNDQGNQAYMFESTTFYVAFGPPLDVLQQKEHVPFKEQLVHVQKCTNQVPNYLKDIKRRPDWGIFFGNPHDRESTGNYSYEELLQEFEEMRNDPECKPKLDDKQLESVDQALRNKITLVQGPPGTGKSYVGERILQFILSFMPEECGPILVVTYKNHALDHFLEDCLTNIPDFKSMLVRVGGGGDKEGTNEDLDACKIFQLMKENRQGRRERDIHFQLEKNLQNQLDAMTPEIRHCVEQLRCCNRYSNIAHVFIEEADEKHLKSLIGDKLDTMTKDKKWRVKHHDRLLKMIKKPLEEWLPSKDEFNLTLGNICADLSGTNDGYKNRDSKSGPKSDDGQDVSAGETDPSFDLKERQMAFDEEQYQQDDSDHEANYCGISNAEEDWILPDISDERLGNFNSILNAGNIKELELQERIQMVYALKKRHYKSVSDRFQCLTEDVSMKCKTKKELNDQGKIDFLKKRRVIGMTVSGAAIKASWLEIIEPSVMIVEEAAEILEPQLVAIIPSCVQHLIMIGDQEQLKPKVSHYKLAREKNLQISMFERLIKGGLDHTQLNKQGRMTDDLAQLVRELNIYDKYETRQEVVAANWKLPQFLPKSMFFYTHTKPEQEQSGTHSKHNNYEARKVAQFAKYLCISNVEPSKITILCSYLAQAKHVKKILDKEGYSSVQDITVTTIDSFQGKEREIIILSLVRSGEGKAAKIGYLASMNRICVAISRARCGLYLFGNMKLLKNKSSKGWGKVIKWMDKQGCVGDVEKSFPFPILNQDGEESDGPVGHNPPHPRSGHHECGAVNIHFNAEVHGPVQIGNYTTQKNTTTVADPGNQNNHQQPQHISLSSPTATPPASPEAPSIEETNKTNSSGSAERLSTEEIRKHHHLDQLGQQSQSAEGTSDAPGPQVPEDEHAGDTGLVLGAESQELSYDPGLQFPGNPLEMQSGLEPREMSFHDGSRPPAPLQETNDIDKRQPQQDSNPPVNKPVQEDTTTGATVQEGATLGPTSGPAAQEGATPGPTSGTIAQEGAAASVSVGMPLQEEKDNAAFQETNPNTKQ